VGGSDNATCLVNVVRKFEILRIKVSLSSLTHYSQNNLYLALIK